MKFVFDENQDFQITAIKNTTDILTDLGDYSDDWGMTDDEIIPNIPFNESIDTDLLLENLQETQSSFNDEMDKKDTPLLKIRPENTSLDIEAGQMLVNVSNDLHEYPSFTIEMETGTGKTYVYLRTIRELNKKYGLSKFIIVVPSVAIYQGVISSFNATKKHFQTIYGNDLVVLRPYSSNRIGDVKAYATNRNIEILLMTLASFNSKSNNIYKSTDKLPGELLPYQYIQKTRPILILDEPQNMTSPISKDALRTLMPLLGLRYSATHKDTPNLLYRLTPIEAYQRHLVKRIQVVGITDKETSGGSLIGLKEVKGTGRTAKAIIVTNAEINGQRKLAEIVLTTGDNLKDKTHMEEHNGFVVTNIGSDTGNEFVDFENQIRLTYKGGDGVSREDIFRFQIRETIDQHILMQNKLVEKGIKVLSLFFVDKVHNYIGDKDGPGFIKQIFEEEFEKKKDKLKRFKGLNANDVSASYFAVYKLKKKGEEEKEVYLDDSATEKKGRAAEKEQFELIMKKKEELLSFKNNVCFIFAHSALKEGWDNPNVFQICTLNQTVSISKKRQEIGRGLRLAVNQEGERIFDDQVNILTVIANESYESFANTLQSEYSEDEGGGPPKPRPKRAPTKRKNAVFSSDEFKKLWDKLLIQSKYTITIDTKQLVKDLRKKLNDVSFPTPKVIVSKSRFILKTYYFELKGFNEGKAIIDLTIEDSRRNRNKLEDLNLSEGTDLQRALKDVNLRGFKVNSIEEQRSDPELTFKNGEKISRFRPLVYEISDNTKVRAEEKSSGYRKNKIFNIVDKLEKATKLTKKTCFDIFMCIPQDEQQKIFQNPDGFLNKLVEITQNELKSHIADHITFEVSDKKLSKNIEEYFPEKITFVQTELVETPNKGLYDSTQWDSVIEKDFVMHKLENDDKVILFFKFPSKYKISFPKLIGNYNPDWGIVRKSDNGEIKIELVRETKGTEEIEKLRFSHEIRKVKVAKKHFDAVGIDYKVIDGKKSNWYKSADGNDGIDQQKLKID